MPDPTPDARATFAMTAELVALNGMTITQLQHRWRELFDEPCHSRNHAYLLKRLRYRIQERAQGGLSEASRQRILTLADSSTLRHRPPREVLFSPPPPPPVPSPAPADAAPAPADPDQAPLQATPQAHPMDPRLPAPGAVLRRVYQGRVCEVKVLDNGFLYERDHYKSLSRVALRITGTPWNGFAFFKLDQPLQRGA